MYLPVACNWYYTMVSDWMEEFQKLIIKVLWNLHPDSSLCSRNFRTPLKVILISLIKNLIKKLQGQRLHSQWIEHPIGILLIVVELWIDVSLNNFFGRWTPESSPLRTNLWTALIVRGTLKMEKFPWKFFKMCCFWMVSLPVILWICTSEPVFQK